jgi:SpoVK/Ycf46/Vps4 family AAA+-type ATPase
LGRELLTMRAPHISPFDLNQGYQRIDAATFNDRAALTKVLDDLAGGPGSLLYLDDLANIAPNSPGFAVLKDFNERNGDRVPLVIAGSKAARQPFAQVVPNTLRKTIEIAPLSLDQAAELVRREVSNDGYELSVEGQTALEKRSRAGGYEAAMQLWGGIKHAQFDRVSELASDVKKQRKTVAYVLARDVEAAKVANRKDPVGNIQKMIGLSAVKEKINGIIGAAALAKQQGALGLEIADPPRLNLLFAGDPGTGKTTVAKELAQALFDEGYVSRSNVAFVTIQDLLTGNPEANVKKLFESNRDGVIFVDEFHQLKDTAEGKRALRAMIPYLADPAYKRTAFIGAGYSDELGELMRDVDPGAQRRFVSVPFANYTKPELSLIEDKMLADAKLEASPEVKAAILERVVRKQRAMKHPGNAGDVDVILGLAREKQRARLGELAKTRKLTAEDFQTLTIEDVTVPNPLSVESVWKEIDALKGNERVKGQLKDMQYLIELNRQLGDDPLTGVEPYIILDGPAGSGKSTLAGLIAKLMAANDIIPDSEVVKITGGDLVGGFIGNSTTLAVRNSFEKAWGKTLFIDEIGALAKAVGGYEEQGAKEMLTQMENNRGKLIVVVADYAHNIDQFLGLDAGLSRRFGTRLSLESMGGAAAAESLKTQLTELKLKLSPALAEHLTNRLETLASLPGWASGGDVRTLANKVKAKQAAEFMTQRKAGKNFDVTKIDVGALDRALDEMQSEVERRPDPNRTRAVASAPLPFDRQQAAKSEKVERVEKADVEVSAAEEEALSAVAAQFGVVFNDNPQELERQTLDANSNYNKALGKKLGISPEAAKEVRVRMRVKSKKMVETMDKVAVQHFKYHCPYCGRVDSPACGYINEPLEWKIEHSTRKPWTETVEVKSQKEVEVEEIQEQKVSRSNLVEWK